MPSRHQEPALRPLSICYVFQDQYPWDIRVEKFVDSLSAAGHRVTILSRNQGNLPRREALAPRIQVERLPGGVTSLDRNLMNFPAFFSPWWLGEMRRVVRREQCDVIIVRDLPLAPAAALIGWWTGTPVVMDMAENYPAMLQATWDLQGPRFVDYFARNPFLLRILERQVLPRLDGIFVVSAPSAKRVVGLTNGRVPVWTVENTPRLDVVRRPISSPLSERLAAHVGLKILYVGHLDAKRGLDMVIRALPSLKKADPNVLAVIVGKGSTEQALRELAKELQVEDNVVLAGWVDQKLVPSLIARADIGIIPHLLNEHTDTTIPNKIYDYMAQGKPVVVTQCQTLRQIVEACECGRVYTDRDPESLSDAIKSLIDGEQRQALGAAGRRAVEARYHWDYDAGTLLNAIQFAAGGSRATPNAERRQGDR